ncbi:hypothetical protein AAFM48_23995 [Burkholderia pseudomallei]
MRYCAPNGQVTQLEYSALGQVTKRSTPEGRTTTTGTILRRVWLAWSTSAANHVPARA